MKYFLLVVLIVLGFAQQPANTSEAKGEIKTGSAQINDRENVGPKTSQPTTPIVPRPQSSISSVTTNNSVGTAASDSRTPLIGESATNDNSKIQRELALFTGLLVFVGFLQVIAIIWQGCVLRQTLGAIRNQAHEMKRQRLLTREQLFAMRGQLEQMQGAGRQTDEIIAQASKQVSATEGQVRLMERAGTHTEDLARQAVRQTELTQKELEMAHRPWIAVDIAPNSGLFFDERGCVIVLNVTMTNVGHSVAKNVSLWTDFAITGIHDPMQVRDKLCSIMKRPENENSDYGLLLFPGQQAVEQRPVIGSLADVQRASAMKVFQGLNAIGLHLVGCVDYPSDFDPKKHHQTRFVYLVGFVDPASGAAKGAFDPTIKIHYNIVLTPTGHGASAD